MQLRLPFKAFEPDFENLLKVLRRERTRRPILFEFILNLVYCREFSHFSQRPEPGSMDHFRMVIEAFKNLGYDYAPVYTWESNLLSFEKGHQDSLASRSQNQGLRAKSSGTSGSDLLSFIPLLQPWIRWVHAW